jgi:hypothetical protein
MIEERKEKVVFTQEPATVDSKITETPGIKPSFFD